MKTVEDILKENVFLPIALPSLKESILKAMESYAEQERKAAFKAGRQIAKGKAYMSYEYPTLGDYLKSLTKEQHK